METQDIHAPMETHEGPQEPRHTTVPAMSRRSFLGAIGVAVAAAATGVLTNGCRRNEQEPEKQVVPHELSPKQAERMIQLLKTRSEAEKNKNLCPNLDWGRAKRALTPEVLLTVDKAEREGHEPTIYLSDETGFDIGTRTDETPQSTRNCVLDKEAAEWRKEHFPSEQFNGSAEEQAETMGWQLMTVDQGKHIAKNTEPYSEQEWSYYRTPEDIRKAGDAIFGRRAGNFLFVLRNFADLPYDHRGWRGTLRVNFVD